MTAEVDIHVADADERRAAYANVHEAWGGDTPLDEWVAGREESARHCRGEWWVLTVDGEVLSSLGCYPLELSFAGVVAPAFGWGAVHTPPAARRRGYAERLCREVLRVCAERGQVFGLLFSGIGAEYYERMGFVPLPVESAVCNDPPALAESGPRAELVPVDPATCLEHLGALYAAEHEHTAVYLARSQDYWRYSLVKEPDTEFVLVPGDAGGAGADGARGFVRFGLQADLLYPEEVVLPRGSAAERAAVWRAVSALAVERGRPRVGGWLSPPTGLADHFARKPLSAIPMVCSLDPSHPVPTGLGPEQYRFYATDHF